MCSSSAMTVGMCDLLSSSATAVPLFSLPEVDETADGRRHGPEDGDGPYVRGQVGGAVAVDEREAHQVHVDGGRVRLEHPGDPLGAAGEHGADREHDTGR